MIDWSSDESHVLVNPAYPLSAQQHFNQILDQSDRWPGHIWLATSGSTVEKWVGLSKKALLASAQAVNTHLESGPDDRWALALPEFHVGGLGIRTRCYLSQAKIFDFKTVAQNGKWNASLFYEFLGQTKSTLTALVPSQLFDLLQLNLKAPIHLRAVIIGGGHLSIELLEKAKQNGWNILPSYGLTECGSQVATARNVHNPQLKVLSHVDVSLINNRLAFKSPALLSTYAYFEKDTINFIDPKVEGWFISMDRGEIKEGMLSIFGRVDECVKIGGENVDISRLEILLQTLRLRHTISQVMTLVALPHNRLGHLLCLVIEGTKNEEIEQQILTTFHSQVLPFERIREVKWIEEIPKSALSKILRTKLIEALRA